LARLEQKSFVVTWMWNRLPQFFAAVSSTATALTIVAGWDLGDSLRLRHLAASRGLCGVDVKKGVKRGRGVRVECRKLS
jgi:hypothetical protein